ncbi:MAG: hypothetical protein PW735_13145 [Acidobacteriaceae bacterium]|nr:hypothetical protein [Acidobacteriaceae bacterium]
MKLKNVALLSAFGALMSATAATAPVAAQMVVGVGIEPVCPYGYFDYAPYDCAPYGYYGPDWFNGGIFIGAGPWFHGHHGFYGHVDNRYDPRRGYNGPLPMHGAQPFNNFHGNEARDGMGHAGNAGHSAMGEHMGGFSGGGHPGGGPR